MSDANAFDFNWKYNDFEIRTTHGLSSNQPYVELVKHDMDGNGRDYIFTLAYWNIGRDGRDGASLSFVADRPFEYVSEIDIGKIWKQLWLAGGMLNDWYEKEFYD